MFLATSCGDSAPSMERTLLLPQEQLRHLPRLRAPGIRGRDTNNGRFSQFIDSHPYLKSRR